MAATGAEIASAYVALTVKAPGLKKDIGKELGSVDTSVYGSQMGSKLADGMKKTLKVAGAGVAAVLGTALVKGFGRLKAIETAQAKMRGLGHDSKTVAKAMDNALASVKGTAFGLGDAATVAGGAMAAQIKPGKELETHLKRIANNAAAAGVGFDEMGSIFNKAATQANGVQNDIIGQLADKGIPIYAELGKQMGVTAGEVFKLASEGKVSFEVFSKAAEAAAGTVAAEMGNTTTGAFDNMMAALGRFGAKLLEDVFPLIGPLFQSITKWLDESMVHIEPFIAAFGERLKSAIDGVKSGWQWLKDNSDWLGPVAVGAAGAAAAIGLWTGATKVWTTATKIASAVQASFNTITKANVIMIVVSALAALVAGLIHFFRNTETGQRVWAEFTRFLGEAWANISGFFTAAYENVIKPVFDGIATVVKWVWETIIQPIFAAIGFAAAILGGVIVGLYEVFVKPAIDAIGVAFTWVYENVIKPAIDGIKLYIQGWAIVLSWLWSAVVKPVLDAIGQAFQWAWNTFIKPAVTAMGVGLKGLGDWFTWLWRNVVKPVWDGISGIIKSAWEKGIKPVIDTLVRVVQSDPKKAFEAARDAIGVAWKGIQDLAKKPVKFVVETVFGGLIDAVNGFLPKGLKLPRPSLPKGFSEGGYTGNIAANAVAGVVHGDEHVIRAASRRAIESKHPGLLDHMNRTGSIPGYRKGGLVHPLPGSVITTQWMGYPGHTGMDFAKPLGTPIQAAAAGVVSKQFYHGMYGNMVDLSHGDGFSTRYAHMLANVAVRLGQVVKAGQVIGYEGSTGNSTGPHLHFETLQNGSPMNPAPFLSGAQTIAPATGVVDGLLDGALSKFKGAFPGGGFFVDAAAGLMRSGVKGITDWISEKLSFGAGGAGIVPTLYDNGGWLQPGRHLVENKTGRPEPILTASQWDAMRAGRDRSGPVVVRIGSRDFEGWMDDRADEAVDRGLSDQEADRRRAMYR